MSDVIQITSRSNPTFQRLRRLATDPRERARTNRTLLEGDHLVDAWLGHGHPVAALAVDAAAFAEPSRWPGVGRVLDEARTRGIEVLAFPAALLDQLSGLDSPSRLLAEIMPRDGDLPAMRGQDVVLLDRLQDPGNVGAILRTCAAAGVGHAVAGPGTAALWSPKVMRAAMGAHALLNLVAVGDLAACCRTLGVPVYGTSSHAVATLDGLDLQSRCAWVFGHEGAGLGVAVEAAVAECGALVVIDQAPEVESLNVAAAAAVCLFEMRRQRRASSAGHAAVDG
jgi:TrmH family RNA methyltransferase